MFFRWTSQILAEIDLLSPSNFDLTGQTTPQSSPYTIATSAVTTDTSTIVDTDRVCPKKPYCNSAKVHINSNNWLRCDRLFSRLPKFFHSINFFLLEKKAVILHTHYCCQWTGSEESVYFLFNFNMSDSSETCHRHQATS